MSVANGEANEKHHSPKYNFCCSLQFLNYKLFPVQLMQNTLTIFLCLNGNKYPIYSKP